MAHGPTIGGPVTGGRKTVILEPPSPPPDVYRLPDTPPPAPPVYYVLMPDYQRPTSTTREVSVDTSDTPEGRVIQVGYGWQKVTPPIAAAKYDTFKIHIVYDLGYGEIDSVSKVLHGEDEIYPTARTGFTVQIKTGTAAQTAFSPAFPDTGWDSTLPGRAMVYVIFDPLSADMTGGNPDITIIYKGKKCYDWRDATTHWTENPFLIAYDMVTNTEYGARVSTAELVTATWTACANRCDEVVDSEARWRAAYMLTDRQGVIDLARDLLQTTCAGGLYYADGGWTAYLDEQHVVGCRPAGTTPVGTTDRAQSFTAPGVRIKAVLKLDLAGGFTTPVLRLRSTLAGADLATYTPSGLVAGTNQEVTFDLSSVPVTVGATYYLVLLATTGVTWHQAATDLYSGGSSWNNVPGWTQEATKDFWFQVHYADHELADQLVAVAGQIPLMAVSGDDVIQFTRSKVSAPRAVSVSCYDVADWIVKPIRFESDDVQSGLVQPDELRVQMAACAGPKQTYRLVRQWQRLAARSLTVTAAVPMHGVAIALGDVAWMTCATGPLTAEWFRVRGVTQGFGTFSLALQEYDWTDYSREETVTLDTAVIPSASSKQKFQKVSDDFTGGGTATGTIGERLWTSAASGVAISYRSEANHAGIVNVGSTGTNGTIRLDNAGAKWAENSAWREKWIFMLHGTLAGTYDLIVQGVFAWRFWRDATEIFSLIVDGADTGINFATNTWIEVDAWCAGDGMAYWIATQGATVASGSKAVSGTTFSAYLVAGTEGTNLTYGTIDVDYAEVAFPTAR